ncbi:MAG: hypothetical protein ACLFTT_12405 [Candidatus Hydrogenedentota bacterium]
MADGKENVEGKERRRESSKGKGLASSSTLNRMELTPEDANADARYKKIVYHPDKIENLLVDIFLCSQKTPPMTRCMAIRKDGSFMATMTVTVTCHSM